MFFDFPVDQNGTILRIYNIYSGTYSTYKFAFYDYENDRETPVFKEFNPYLTEHEYLKLLGPLIVGNKWDGKSFLLSEVDSTSNQDGSIIYGHYIHFKHYILKFENSEWSYQILPYDSVYNKSTIQNEFVQNTIESLLEAGRLTFEGFPYFSDFSYNGLCLPLIENELYFFIKEKNQDNEEAVISKSFTKVFNIPFERYRDAIEYFYEPFYVHLQKDGKLHVFAVENTCQNVTAEYVQYSGYKINGKINGNLYHYIVDLTKEDYLKPIFEEKILEFEW